MNYLLISFYQKVIGKKLNNLIYEKHKWTFKHYNYFKAFEIIYEQFKTQEI